MVSTENHAEISPSINKITNNFFIVEFTSPSKNTNTQLQQMKIRLAEIQNKEAQVSFKYYRKFYIPRQ